MTATEEICGHSASGNGFNFVCDLPEGHTGLHRQRTQLRDSVSITNWGDDGKAIHATSDTKRLRESGRR